MYEVIWSSTSWSRVQVPYDCSVPSCRKELGSRRTWDFQSVTFRLGGRSSPGFLSTDNRGDFVQVQDQWCIMVHAYDVLRDRYRRDKRTGPRNQRQLQYTTVPLLDPDWRPRNGPSLTSDEILYLTMRPEITSYTLVYVNRVQFRCRSSQMNFRKDDSVIKTWYHDSSQGGAEVTIYGVIDKMFTHSLYPGGPVDVILQVEWLEPVDDGHDHFLPQVRFNPESQFNQRARFVFLRQCAAYNIMIAPHDPWDPENDVYDVIDRWRTYEDHSVS